MTSAAIWLASPGWRSSTSRRLRNSNGRAASSAGGPALAAPRARRAGSPLRAGGPAGATAHLGQAGQHVLDQLGGEGRRGRPRTGARLSLLRVGLKTKAWMPICRARRRSDWLRLSVIISTGGRRFIFQSRLTTSKPPWNEAPPEAGIPRSVTSTKGVSVLRGARASFAAASGSPASSMLGTRRRRSGRPRIPRTSSSSSTSRMRARGPPGRRGVGAAAGAGAPAAAPARGAGGSGRRLGGAAGGAGACRAAAPGEGRRTASGAIGSGAGSARDSLRRAERRLDGRRGHDRAGVVGVDELLRGRRERGLDAPPRTRAGPRPCPRARSRSISWGLMPPTRVSTRDVPARRPCGGTSSVSSKPKAPSRRRASCSRAKTMRERISLSRASSGGSVAEARVDRRRARGEGRDDEAVAEDDRPLALLHLDRQVARLLAERDDLDDVEEGQVLEIASVKGSRALLVSELDGFYTAARISSAMRSSGHRLRSTTPASTAALGMP